LKVLRIAHGRVIDTAALFPHPRGLPLKLSLKSLAKNHLNIDIQTGTSTWIDFRSHETAALIFKKNYYLLL
jgi:hypothetical protein